MNEDFLDLLGCLRAAEVRFLVVGGYAVGVHGRPRATKDLDVWVDATPDNAVRVLSALRQFGAPIGDLSVADLDHPGTGFQMGMPPRRIDVLTTIDGVEFDDAWARRIDADFGGDAPVPVLGLDDLLANKRAAGRPEDLADVAVLTRGRR